MRVMLAALMICGLLAAAGTAHSDDGQERFTLWNDCKPVSLAVISTMPELPREAIEQSVRNQLQATQITLSERGNARLLVTVHGNKGSGPQPYVSHVFFVKPVEDILTKSRRTAPTWLRFHGGTRTGTDILARITQDIQNFVVSWLRVNADAC